MVLIVLGEISPLAHLTILPIIISKFIFVRVCIVYFVPFINYIRIV